MVSNEEIEVIKGSMLLGHSVKKICISVQTIYVRSNGRFIFLSRTQVCLNMRIISLNEFFVN